MSRWRQTRAVLIEVAIVVTVDTSQRRLFSVSIYEYNHQRWANGAAHSDSKARLLVYVRSLSHRYDLDILTEYPAYGMDIVSAIVGVSSSLPPFPPWI